MLELLDVRADRDPLGGSRAAEGSAKGTQAAAARRLRGEGRPWKRRLRGEGCAHGEHAARTSPPEPFVGFRSHMLTRRCSEGTRGSAPLPTSACAARTAHHCGQLAGSTRVSFRLGT